MSVPPVVRRLGGVVLLIVLAALLFTTTGHRKMRDFEVYWTAGARAAASAPLYRPGDGHYQFKYLPGFAVAVAPLSRLPLPAAKALWMVLSVLCLAALVQISVRSAAPSPLGTAALAALTVIAMAKFFAHELVLGQANLLFGALCVAGLRGLLRGRDAAAGAWLGGAVLVKPYAVLFVPYLLLIGRWRAALAAMAAALAVVALPVVSYGIQGTERLTRDWWRTATESSSPLLTNPDSISIFAMYAKWLGWGSAAAVLSIVTIGLLAAVFLAVIARRASADAPEVLEVGLALTLIPLITPQGWDYVLLLSTPLISLLIARASRMATADRAVLVTALSVVAFSLYDVMGREAYARFMGLAIITVCYLAIVGVALRARLARIA